MQCNEEAKNLQPATVLLDLDPYLKPLSRCLLKLYPTLGIMIFRIDSLQTNAPNQSFCLVADATRHPKIRSLPHSQHCCPSGVDIRTTVYSRVICIDKWALRVFRAPSTVVCQDLAKYIYTYIYIYIFCNTEIKQ